MGDAVLWRGTQGHLGKAAMAAGCLVSLLLAGCGGGSMSRNTGPAPAQLPREAIVGSWGIASFHNEKDRKRTEAEARAQCRQPYVISLGPTDGVMMHVADDAKIYELRLKAGADGTTYIGFEAPAGDPQDRQILSATDTELIMRFVDPDAHRRYGTFVFIRCS
ncbi:hypothetical protein FHS82_002540 [Pseudochelatococcus lubricantis]|uniref:Lipoprotein n=1 Tax=Pseudochelatococcus lubricantis TaxID=1538102 RepID=A0ABX0V123_9HYPH|nr:hypothetical protein [Pseudochelatococcus lubricantis]NIJ58692.1 hypothetical protein [Pseudochelatococcus lubricantis]